MGAFGCLMKDTRVLRPGSLVLLIFALAGCTGMRPVIRHSGPAAEAETRLWRDEILRQGQDGDWLVIRGYNSSDHLVATAANSALSHVGILDARDAQVIEAVSPAVRVVALQRYLEGADRVLLVRPTDADVATGQRALELARTQIGAPYDFLGTVGLPERGKYYCSELAAWSVGREVDVDGPGRVLYPADMLQFGTVLYDSDSRSSE